MQKTDQSNKVTYDLSENPFDEFVEYDLSTNPFDEFVETESNGELDQEVQTHATNQDEPGIGEDMWGMFGMGSGQLLSGAGWLFGSDKLSQLGEDTTKYWEESLSQAQKASNKKRFVEDDFSAGEALTDPRSWAGVLMQSIPAMSVGMGAASLTGRGAAALGASKATSSTLAAGAATGTEGTTIAAMVGDETYKAIMDSGVMINTSPYYQELLKLKIEPEKAREMTAQKAAESAALPAGVGGAILGVFFNKFIGDAVTGNLSKRVGKEAFKGGVIEAATEATQGTLEQVAKQKALYEHASQVPNLADIANEVVAGAGTGAAMGSTVGAAGALSGKQEAQPEQTDEPNIPTLEPEQRVDNTQEKGKPQEDKGFTEFDIEEELKGNPFDEFVEEETNTAEQPKEQEENQSDKNGRYEFDNDTGIYRVPVKDIKVDPKSYQFRTNVNESGVDNRLDEVKEWDDERAGVVTLHRRNNGDLYVSDGHHRVNLAKRLGAEGLNARIKNESEGVTVEKAMVGAALNNIANDNADAIDIAKVLRFEGGTLDSNNLPRTAKGKRGEAISKLNDNVYGLATNGQLSEEDAAVIGASFEQNQQDAAANTFIKIKPETEYQRQLLVGEIQAAEFAKTQGDQGGLFGDDPQEVSLMQDRLKVLDSLRQKLNADKKLFASLNKNADRASEAGNKIAKDTNSKISERSAKSLELISRVATTPDLNEMVNKAARRVFDGESVSDVTKDLKKEILSYERNQNDDRGRSGETILEERARRESGRQSSENGDEHRRGEQVLEGNAEGSADQGQHGIQQPVRGEVEESKGQLEDDLLTSYSEKDLKDKADAEAKQLQAEEEKQQKAEAKEKADRSVNDFQLTGSDRTADSNPNQTDLLDSSLGTNQSNSKAQAPSSEEIKKKIETGTAPEHVQVGVDDRELSQIVEEFNSYQQSMFYDDDPISKVFFAPKKNEIVRLADKVKVYNKKHGWMTPNEAKAKISEWKENALSQYADTKIRSENSNKVVLSLFDLSGKWSEPWEQAGYEVWRFDIQNDPELGDINNFSTEFFGDWFGDFEGKNIYAILAACPCTDFASSGARHFAAKDIDGRTVASVKLVQQTLRTIEYFKPAVWAVENPVGRIEKLGGLPPWRLSFDPNHLGEDYTKKTLIWGRFNSDLPIAPAEPTQGSKMHTKYGGKSLATKNARSATPEGFAYGFFQANNFHDNKAMGVSNTYDRLDADLIKEAIDNGVEPEDISNEVDDYYYIDLDDEAANNAIRALIQEKAGQEESKGQVEDKKANRAKPSSNKIFTDDAAEKARAILKSKLGQLNSGIDPEILQAGITLAGYHIEKGARTFSAYAKAMTEDLGDIVKPYLKSWYMGVKYDPRAASFEGMSSAAEVESAETEDELNTENGENAKHTSESQKPDSGENDYSSAEEDLFNEGRGRSRQGAAEPREKTSEVKEGSGEPLGNSGSSANRKSSNKRLHNEKPRVESSTTGSVVDSGSLPDSTGGLFAEQERAGTTEQVIGKTATEHPSVKKGLVRRDTIALGDATQIKERMPFLTDGQVEDVAIAESRFSKDDGYGMMFTNGTGTGKTFTGLGIARRFVDQGKKNILVVAPKQTIADAWMKEGSKFFDLNVSRLSDVKDKGEGIVVTTYANMGQNDAIVERDWDLVITDESHYLSSDQEGSSTKSLSKLRALTLKEGSGRDRVFSLNPDKVQEMKELRAEANAGRNADDDRVKAAADKAGEKAAKILDELHAEARAEEERMSGIAPKDKPRALFLSATPFAYDKNIVIGQGFLFDWGNDRGGSGSKGYNHADNFQDFMMTHFGYRMRYGKLTQPDANVDSGLMERAFNAWLKKEGVLSGRMLDSDFDYDRRFVLAESVIGRRVDDAITWLRGHEVENESTGRKEARTQLANIIIGKNFDYHARMYFLEAIKAREALPYIKEYVESGYKVLVMHDYKKGGTVNPFRINPPSALRSIYYEFKSNFDDLIESFSSLPSPISLLSENFPDALIYNGDVSAKKRIGLQNEFNDDSSGAPNLMIAQGDAMREGVSIHDTTGKHKRVLIHLGMPVKPTAAIQQEGRIYRTGQASDAIFRYFTIGSNWERYTFASTISQRAGTAENLAMGELARGLQESFIEAYEDAGVWKVGMADEGKGGRAKDAVLANLLTPWDMAKSYYFGTKKQGSGRSAKSREGNDYFATPEPLGMKMVEWADIRSGESVLEPSAGHGAIGRFFPETTTNKAIEQSDELASKLSLRFSGDVLTGDFEDHNIVNKYDAIVMNPPYGSGGKTAAEHVRKAIKHLRDGGRIVALIPTGPAADKQFDKLLHPADPKKDKDAKDIYTVSDITLPRVTFERAGTSVSTRVLVLEKISDQDQLSKLRQVNRDYSNADTIEEFFDRIENAEIPPRLKAVEDNEQQVNGASLDGVKDSSGFTAMDSVHSKNGNDLFVVNMSGDMGDNYDAINQIAKKHDGFYIRARMRNYYKPKDGSKRVGTPSFTFSTSEDRAAFLSEVESDTSISFSISPDNNTVATDQKAAISEKEANSIIDRVTFDWNKGREGIELVSTFDELPSVIKSFAEQNGIKPGQVKGVYHREKLYLVRDTHQNAELLERTIFHEAYGHYGVYKLFGQNVSKVLNQIYVQMGGKTKMLAYAKKHGIKLDRYFDITKELEPNARNTVLMSELLAHMAEDQKPSIKRKIKELIGFVRNWLREKGFMKLANYSESDLFLLLKRAKEAVQNIGGMAFVKEEETQRDDSSRMERAVKMGYITDIESVIERRINNGRNRSRSSQVRSDQRRSEGTRSVSEENAGLENRRGAGDDSKSARPQVFYHGTRDTIEAFDLNHPNKKDHGWLGRGVYVTNDERFAKAYSKLKRGSGSAQVMPLFIKAKKLYEMSIEEKHELSKRSKAEVDQFTDNLIAQGYDGSILEFPEDNVQEVAIFHTNNIRSVDAQFNPAKADSSNIYFSLQDNENTNEKRKRIKKFFKGLPKQPLDRMFRVPFDALNTLDSHGRFKPGTKLSNKAEDVIKNWQPYENGRFSWITPFIESARHGLIDRYKLSDEYKTTFREAEALGRNIDMQALDILKKLEERGVDAAEAAVLQRMLTGEKIKDHHLNAVAAPILKAIDDLGLAAVEYGVITREQFERNRGAYLHRSYVKHEGEFTGLGKWILDKQTRSNKRKIQGKASKGRGIEIKLPMDRLLRHVPSDWFGIKTVDGKPDFNKLNGQQFYVLDNPGMVPDYSETFEGMETGDHKKIVETIYWPEDLPLPAKYRDYRNRGTFEVRGKRMKNVVLWRDYTKAERENMGEILDARYNIAKTFQVISRDIAMGKFFQDVSKNDQWFARELPPGETALTSQQAKRLSNLSKLDWVHVPDTSIAGSAGTKQWGALAGGYVRSEIWRDLTELDKMHNQNIWHKVLTQWKLNKTARSPVVHMNNVMSNIMFMDLADVRMTDLVSGIKSYYENDEHRRSAEEHGAFEGSFASEELRKQVMEPILNELMQQNAKASVKIEENAVTMWKLLGKAWSAYKKADNAMVGFYQVEDELFRMATYMRRLSLGDSPQEAARMAREQFLDYDIRAPWINAARRSVLPFISYTYRAVPVLAKAIAERPWKVAKYVTLAHLATAFAYMLDYGDEDEERRTMREDQQGYTWLGVPRMARMPWHDEYGNPVFLDIRRWIPAGDIFDMNQGSSALAIPSWLQFGGPLMLGAEFITNKQAFTGREITNETDSGLEALSKTGDWLYKSWMPSAAYVPGSYYWDKLGTAWKGGRDLLGRPYSFTQAMLSSIGIKVQPHDIKLGYTFRSRDLAYQARQIKGDIAQAQSDLDRNLIPKAEYNRIIADARKKLLRLKQKNMELNGQGGE